MKYLVEKDKKRRINFANKERTYLILKALVSNIKISLIEKLKFNKKLHKYKNKSKIKIRNRCFLTGRARSVSRIMHMTRMHFKEKALFGKLIGIKKSSW